MKPSLVAAALVLVTACGDKPAATDETSTGDTSSETSSGTFGMSSTPTSGDEPATNTSNTSDATTTAPDPSTTSQSTSSDVTTGETTDLGELCEMLCARGPECDLRPGGDPCMNDCLADTATLTGLCADTAADTMQCLLGLPCAQWVPFAEQDDPGPCQGELDQQVFVCSLDGCDAGGGIGEDGTSCSFTKQCDGEPLERMECDQTMCTCFLGDEQIGTCGPGDACIDAYHTAMWIQVCCAF